MSTTIEITPSQLKSVLRDCHAAKLNPFIQGQPGVGKSAIVAEFARESFQCGFQSCMSTGVWSATA